MNLPLSFKKPEVPGDFPKVIVLVHTLPRTQGCAWRGPCRSDAGKPRVIIKHPAALTQRARAIACAGIIIIAFQGSAVSGMSSPARIIHLRLLIGYSCHHADALQAGAGICFSQDALPVSISQVFNRDWDGDGGIPLGENRDKPDKVKKERDLCLAVPV